MFHSAEISTLLFPLYFTIPSFSSCLRKGSSFAFFLVFCFFFFACLPFFCYFSFFAFSRSRMIFSLCLNPLRSQFWRLKRKIECKLIQNARELYLFLLIMYMEIIITWLSSLQFGYNSSWFSQLSPLRSPSTF